MFKVKDGIRIGAQEFVDSSRNVAAGTITASDVTISGELRGPATMYIDPAAVGDNTGTLVIRGNLQVDGTTTTINSTTVAIDDLNLQLASDAPNAAAANGAGITIAGASATFTYASSGDKWQLNKPLQINSDDGVKAVFGGTDGQTWLRGWGLESDRGAVYIRPTGNATQTLRIGYTEGSLNWNTVKVDTSNFITTGIVKTNADRLVLRDDSIEVHATDNDSAGVAINYYGYASGTTRFRDFNVYDGKGSLRFKTYGAANYAYSPSSFRAPIFYDSDDTTYYLDPNSVSNIFRLNVVGHNDSSPSSTYGIQMGGGYAGIKVWNFNPNGSSIYRNLTFYGTGWDGSNVVGRDILTIGNYGGYVGIRENNPNNFLQIGSVGSSGYGANHIAIGDGTYAYAEYLNGGSYMGYYTTSGYFYFADRYLQAAGSMRAPIFYDSDDTGYYVNPNSYSRINTIAIGNQGSLIGGDNTYPASIYHNQRYLLGFRNSSSGTSNYPWLVHDNWNGDAVILHFNGIADRFRFSSGGIGQADSDFRAPIFYDSNDTNYYLDANNTSRLNYLRPNSISLVGQVDNGTPRWDFKAYVVESTHHYGQNSTQTMYLGEDNYIMVRTNAEATGSFRAPIFYDSNDTTYYIDPNSASNSALRMRGGALFGPNPTWGQYLYVGTNGSVDVNTATVAVTNGNLHLDAKNGYLIYLNNYSTSSYTVANQSIRSPIFYDLDDTGYYVNPNGVSVFSDIRLANGNWQAISGNTGQNLRWRALAGSSNLGFSFYDANDGWRMQLYAGTDGYGFLNSNWGAWDVRKVPSGNLFLNDQSTYYINGSEIFYNRVYGNTDIRSPIFYDYNNTGYYVDPNGSSRFNEVYPNNVYNYGWFTNQYSAQGLYNTANDAHFYSAGPNYWHINPDNGSVSQGGLIFYDQYNSTQNSSTGRRGSVYWDSAGFGLLDSTGTWSVNIHPTNYRRVTIGGYTGQQPYSAVDGIRLMFGGGDDNAAGSYYIGTNLENYGGTYTKLDLRWHTGIRIGAQPGYGGVRIYDNEGLGTVRFSVNKGDAHTRVESGDFYAANLYDRDDTNYYLNPNGTSRLNRLETTVTSVHGAKRSYYVGNLTADGVQARRFEIARIYIDFNDWHSAGIFQVELHNNYYFGGDYQLWNISYDYNNVSCNLISGDSPRGRLGQVTCSSPVQISGDYYYISVYVDVRYYGYYYGIVHTSWPETTTHQAQGGNVLVYTSPSVSNISDFTPTNTITTTNIISSTSDIRAPIFYDSDNTAYRVNPQSSSIFNSLTLGSTTATDVTLGISGTTHITGANALYFGGTMGSVGSWGGRITQSGSGTLFSAQYWEFNGGGYGGGNYFTIGTGGTTTYGTNDTYLAIGASDDVRTGLRVYDTTAMAAGVGGQLVLGYKYTASGNYTEGAIIKMYKLNGNDGDYSSGLKFQVRDSGENLATRMFMHPSGYLENDQSFRAPIFYDSSDTYYFCDPNSTSRLYRTESFYFRNVYDVSSDHPFGIFFANNESTAYAIYRESGAWDFPYPDLRIAFHTGIKIGANANYKGVRFYTDYDMSTLVMSVNNADYVTGGVYIHTDLRAPILYDGNNTAYYDDPASTSRFNVVHANYFLGEITDSGSGDSNAPFRFESDYSGWATIFAGTPGSSNGWGTFWAGNDNAAYRYFDTVNPNEYVFVGNGGVRASIDLDNGQSYFDTSIRSPIFYDSNNTGYYVDPASTDYSARFAGNLYFVGYPKIGIEDGGMDCYLYITDNNPVVDGVGYGGEFYFYGDKSISSSYLNFGGAVVEQTLRANGSLRAPIFYDQDDTNYYLNPNGSSRLNSTFTDNSYTYGWFRTYGTSGLYNESYGNHWYATGNDYWNLAGNNSVNVGILFRTGGHQGPVRGYVYADSSNNIGFLNSGGSWRLRVVGDDYSLADGSSMRAQIFYDSNNTAYYGDFASTTYLNKLRVNNTTGPTNSDLGTAADIPLHLYGTSRTTNTFLIEAGGAFSTDYGHIVLRRTGTPSSNRFIGMLRFYDNNSSGVGYSASVYGFNRLTSNELYLEASGGIDDRVILRAGTSSSMQVAQDFIMNVKAAIYAVTTPAALDIDCKQSNYFTKTISSDSTFTFSNVPAPAGFTIAYSFTLELTHTSGTITWPASVKWPGNVLPSLATGKTHLFMFVTDDGGSRWRGSFLSNYDN